MKQAFLVPAALLLAACNFSMEKEYPEKKYYLLEASYGKNSGNKEALPETSLAVRKFRISPAFAGTAFVYRMGPLQYDEDFYHEFFISPSMMITTKKS